MQLFSEQDLLVKDLKGKTNLENMLETGFDPNFAFYCKEESIRIIFNKKRYDMLEYKCSIQALLATDFDKISVLEMILKLFKEKKIEIDISQFNPKLYDVKNTDIVKVYLLYAKYDLLEYLPKLTLEELKRWEKGKTLLDLFLETNKKATTGKILSPELLRNFEVLLHLKVYNIVDFKAKVPLRASSIVEDYYKKINSEYDGVLLPEEAKNLLDLLKESLVSNGEEELVNTFINLYKMQVFNENEHALDEINQLAELAINGNNLSLIFGDRCCYKDDTKNIVLSRADMSSLAHELGHFFFALLAGSKIPEEFDDMLMKVRENSTTIDNVAMFTDEYYRIEADVYETVNSMYDNYFANITSDEEVEKIRDFLNDNRKSVLKKYVELGYKEEDVSFILNRSFTVEEYLEQHKQIMKDTILEIVLDTEYDTYLAIADILDAIYGGMYLDGMLVDSNGNKIRCTFGHGISYYRSKKSLVFDEIIANYSQIDKSPKRKEALQLLRGIVGDEFVNFIEKYYNDNILKSTKYEVTAKL